ncbi:MAG: ribulose-phosphate 3-epimerase [Elusimicrobia bacterium CG06_land_8_20_14_3_00_38_11]|nr:MAG: ribulose-phosphate 3-epimerase [Elusimicrobia bacterium CG06_land_8_20_14_3_00_38_11]
MIEIAPSILSADFSNLADEIKKCEKAGVKILHIDIMDGHFVPNITIGPVVVESLRKKTKMILDTHLMITDPEKYIEPFAKAGSDWLTFHIEAVKKPSALIKKIKSLKLKAGISLNPATPVSKLSKYLNELDLVLVMSVNPGFGGQGFIPSALKKISELKKLTKNQNVKISVDGGINFDTISGAVKAGSDIIVAGNSVFRSGLSIAKSIKKLRLRIEKHE